MAVIPSVIVSNLIGLWCLLQVVKLCPNGCASCINGNTSCNTCLEGFWSYNNECSQCPENCKTCMDNTACQSCMPHFYGIGVEKCKNPCSSNCKNSECYDSNGYCKECYTGWYGPVCGENCNLCRNASCDLRSCSQGCNDGYLQSNRGDYSYCFSCPSNCMTCLNTTFCTQCSNQYSVYDYILQIHDGSVRGRADCMPCSGSCANCESILHCSTCQQSSEKLVCSQCKDGYVLDYTQCVQESSDSCNVNCRSGGNLESRCHKNGTCLYGCEDRFSGADCSIEVLTTNKTTTTSTTTITTATKSTTFYSDHIPLKSNETVVTFSSVTEMQSKVATTKQYVTAAVIGGGVGGGLVLLVIVIFIVCLIIKRNRKDNDQPNVVSAGISEAVNPIFDPEIPNSASDKQQTVQSLDYIYALPNKSKKINDLVGGSEPKTFASIEIDLNADNDAFEETDSEDILKLEDLDDGEADMIVPDNYAPTSDTYYNTEGLVRSRIQVSKLLNYIQDKSDFQSEFERLPMTLTRSCNEALKPQNRAKNRYNGIYSYDATRVVLRSKEYINASHIEGYNKSNAYIASLGPTKSTMPQFAVFWEMVWQEKTQKIVMLTNLNESGKMKCDQYWPDNGFSRQYGYITVSAKAEHLYAEFVVRELHVLKAGESRTVTQYHYIAWPDKSVPDTLVSLVEFRDMVEKMRTPNAGPMIVHCSAGIGRTGTFIALDTLIKEGKAENYVDVFGCVNALRGQRVHMVQNVEQYVFLHHCVVYALTCQPGPLDVSSLTSYTRGDNMNAQFQALTNFPTLANKESDSIATNTKRKENRKESDIPGDLHRVKLRGTKKDYINAVFVDGYLQTDRYILAQTPMPSTLEDFVSLLYQEKIELIVSLDEEDGKDNLKSIGQYVSPANKVSKIGHFTVSTVSCESSEDFVVRILRISKLGQSNANDVNIRHYHFQVWKNTDSVPESLQAFMKLITALNKLSRQENGKVLFHCLDGATKSGLLCAVAIMLEKLAVERELSVINTICQVRGRRRKALHEFDQFKFCYNCVREHLETSEAKAYYNIL